jgi:hypothetical protein
LFAFFLAGFGVWLVNNLGIVFEDIGQSMRREYFAPQ